MNALARILSRPVSAVLVDHENMAPALPRGSLAFLGEPGFVGEGLYALGNAGWHPSDIRHVYGIGDRRFLSMDNWPGEPEEVATAALLAMVPQQVIGLAVPLTTGFAAYLREWRP